MIRLHGDTGKIGLVMSVRARLDYHLLHSTSTDKVVRSVERLGGADVRINGGFFVFRQEIFDVIGPVEDPVGEPFARLIEQSELLAYPYDGFGSRWTRSRTRTSSTSCSKAETRSGYATHRLPSDAWLLTLGAVRRSSAS